jgi:hypothetical protein
MGLLQRIRNLKASSWAGLLLFFPPLYGLWLLSRTKLLGRNTGLYRFFAHQGIWLPLLSIIGIMLLGSVGVKSTDQLVELLIAYPWIPVLLTALFSLGIAIPAAVCGWMLLRSDRRGYASNRWRKFWRAAGWMAWPLGAWQTEDKLSNR